MRIGYKKCFSPYCEISMTFLRWACFLHRQVNVMSSNAKAISLKFKLSHSADTKRHLHGRQSSPSVCFLKSHAWMPFLCSSEPLYECSCLYDSNKHNDWREKIKSDHYLHIQLLTPHPRLRLERWILLAFTIFLFFSFASHPTFFLPSSAPVDFVNTFPLKISVARCLYHFCVLLCSFKDSFVFKYRLFMLRLLWDLFFCGVLSFFFFFRLLLGELCHPALLTTGNNRKYKFKTKKNNQKI